MSARAHFEHSLSRWLLTLLGAPTVAFIAGAAIASFLPGPEETAFAFGIQLMIPIWVALSCLLPLARSASRAWVFCIGVSGPPALALVLRGGV